MNHGAGVIVVRKDGAVLVQHRENRPDIFYPDHWCYPAGTVDGDEDFKEAARRELEEETGYRAETLYPLPEEEYTRSDGQTVRRHIYWTIYDERQKIQCNEGAEMMFLCLEDLRGKKLLPGQERLFHLAVAEAKKRKI